MEHDSDRLLSPLHRAKKYFTPLYLHLGNEPARVTCQITCEEVFEKPHALACELFSITARASNFDVHINPFRTVSRWHLRAGARRYPKRTFYIKKEILFLLPASAFGDSRRQYLLDMTSDCQHLPLAREI